MERAILWGLGVGLIMSLYNYLFFVKIFPPDRFIKMSVVLQRVLGLGYFLLMFIFFFNAGEFLGFFPTIQHEDSNPAVFGMFVLLISFGSLLWFSFPLLVARGFIKSGGKEGALSLLFLVLCFIGIGFGTVVGLFVLYAFYNIPFGSNATGIPHYAFWICLVPSMFMSIPFFSIPIFLLALKPFYTKEAIIRFTLSGRNTNLLSGALSLMNFIYKVAFFWINLFYPGKDAKFSDD